MKKLGPWGQRCVLMFYYMIAWWYDSWLVLLCFFYLWFIDKVWWSPNFTILWVKDRPTDPLINLPQCIMLHRRKYWSLLFLTKGSPTDRRTNGPTNWRTDGQTSYRDARTHLKSSWTNYFHFAKVQMGTWSKLQKTDKFEGKFNLPSFSMVFLHFGCVPVGILKK